MADRWTEFPEWCDEMIKFAKDNIEQINKLDRICGTSSISERRLKYHELSIKIYELRKERYYKTGDSRGMSDPEIAKLYKQRDKVDEMFMF